MANVIREDVVKLGFEVEGFKELTKLQDEVNELKKTLTGGIGDDALEDLKKSANNAVSPLNKCKNAASNLKDKVVEIGNKAATTAYNGLKKMAGVSFKALTAGIGVAAVGLGGIIVKATQSFADFEQLSGGVDTLFKGSAGIVKKYANDAYKTAGLSANEYMETVTSFSASLIQSCGGDTAKAAELANTAISDMSDNANKMGTDMGMIQNAYQGFAKQNYTMLDNLKLGYGGTKTEMQRLIKDAAKLDKSVDANSMSYSNIVKAIHAVQKNMDILGTTQKEAEKTVTGSLNSMKSAWGNLLTAIGSGENLDQCFENMIKSAETFGNNIIPVIERGLDGMVTVIDKLAPVIADKLPAILEKTLPKLISAAGKVVGALVKALPSIIKALIPAIKEAAAEIVRALYEAFTGKEMSADTFEGVKSTIDGLCSTMKIAVPIVLGLLAAFKAYTIVKKIVGGISSFAKGIGSIASKVSGGLATKMTSVAGGMSKTGQAAKTNSKDMLAAAGSFLMIAAAVLLVAVGFGILVQSSIALAGAGWGAIAVMIGMVAALVALGFGMYVLLQALSNMGTKALQGSIAMLLLGVAIVLVAAGFAILAFSAIALTNAGGAAIAVFFGLIIAVAALAIVVAVLGSAMLTGAVGFLVFGAAILLVGTGFMLMGVGALLAAASLTIIVGVLPQIVEFGLLGAISILALGAALIVFSAGAALTAVALLALSVPLLIVSAAFLVIGAAVILVGVGLMLIGTYGTMAAAGIGALAAVLPTILKFALLAPAALITIGAALTVFGAGALVAGVGLTVLGVGLAVVTGGLALLSLVLPLIAANATQNATALVTLAGALAIFGAGALVAGAASIVLGAGLLVIAVAMLVLVVTLSIVTALTTVLAAVLPLISVQLVLISAMTIILSASLLLLTTYMMILTPLLLVFAAALLPLSATMLLLTPITLLFTATMSALMAVFMILSPLALLFTTAMLLLAPAFIALGVSVPLFAKALKQLPKAFTKLIVPAGLLLVAITPLSLAFMKSAVSAVTLLTAVTGLAVSIVAACSALALFVVILSSGINSAAISAVAGVKNGFAAMVTIVQVGTLKMTILLMQMLKQMTSIIRKTDLASEGAFMINGLIRGMNSRKAAAISTARSIAQAINKEYRKVQDINSPSGEWENYGAYQIQGDINGMKKKMPALKSAVQDVSEMSLPYTGNYTPENTTSYSSSRNTEYNTYSPQFNFSASGTSDDRAMLRKMKRMFMEAWEEMLDGYESKMPKVQEV